MARDLTREQFRAALDRNGFGRQVMFWIESGDDDGRSYGMTLVNGKINRRATLARIIAERARVRAKDADEARPKTEAAA